LQFLTGLALMFRQRVHGAYLRPWWTTTS